LLDAQRQRADAEVAYFSSLVDYMRAIAGVHFRKGSLPEYDGVYLSEGPWPAKAQWDAHRLARQRDASHYLNYGFTRPEVISRGPYLQNAGDKDDPRVGGKAVRSTEDSALQGETVPTPVPATGETTSMDESLEPIADSGKSKSGFDWGSLGMRSGGAARPLAVPTGANPNQGTTTSLRVVKSQAPADDSNDDSAAADQGVRQAVYQSAPSSDSSDATDNQSDSAPAKPVTTWQVKKR
jgi:hypothetical protein